MCWEVRDGSLKANSNIVLGKCHGRNEKIIFDVNSANGPGVVSVHPSGAEADKLILGAKKKEPNSRLRVEKPVTFDETQTLYQVATGGMVGIGFDGGDEDGADFYVDNPLKQECVRNGDCLFFTNRGNNANYGDPVVVKTKKKIDKTVKNGDTIKDWKFIEVKCP